MTRLLSAFFGGTATADPTYRFTGHEWDEDTELLYAGARYYDPRLALWLSADPEIDGSAGGGANGGVFAPGNLAAYAYVHGNPLRYRDPDGRWGDDQFDPDLRRASGGGAPSGGAGPGGALLLAGSVVFAANPLLGAFLIAAGAVTFNRQSANAPADRNESAMADPRRPLTDDLLQVALAAGPTIAARIVAGLSQALALRRATNVVFTEADVAFGLTAPGGRAGTLTAFAGAPLREWAPPSLKQPRRRRRAWPGTPGSLATHFRSRARRFSELEGDFGSISMASTYIRRSRPEAPGSRASRRTSSAACSATPSCEAEFDSIVPGST